MSTTFRRVREDFTCDHCGTPVVGDGFTNHCPICLWSKHVDQYPGDRVAACQGLMPPIRVELVKDEFIISHRCQTCGLVRRNRAAANDDHDLMIAITAAVARRFSR